MQVQIASNFYQKNYTNNAFASLENHMGVLLFKSKQCVTRQICHTSCQSIQSIRRTYIITYHYVILYSDCQSNAAISLTLHHNIQSIYISSPIEKILFRHPFPPLIHVSLIDCGIDDIEALYLFKALPSCITLNLAKNDISERGLLILGNEKLESFNLYHNQIQNFTLCKLDLIQSIEMSCNQLGTTGAKDLAKSIKNNTILTALCIADNNIQEEGAYQIAEALINKKHLSVLNIGNNQIMMKGAISISKALIGKNMQSLCIHSNCIESQGALEIAKCLEDSTNLDTLVIGDNGICTEGARKISKALSNKKKLRSVYIGWNDIKYEGILEITKALMDKDIVNLSIGGNDIRCEGAFVVSSLLENKSCLSALYVGDNNITDEGAKALIKALSKSNLHVLGITII